MILYNLRSADGEWRITKFDEDLEMESSYVVSTSECECPQWQSRERECRHMKMLPMMLERADSPWFFCYEDAKWYDPTGEANRPEALIEPPAGITVISLDNPELVHNTIAKAVGEPTIQPPPGHRFLTSAPVNPVPIPLKRRF